MRILAAVMLLLSLLLLLPTNCTTTNATTSEDFNNHLQSTDALKNMWSESLSALYKLSQNFVIAISGNGLLGPLAAEFGIDLTSANDQQTNNSANIQKTDLNALLPKVARAGAGYIVIIIIGIILTIFFLLACFCFTCFRKCGCYCGKVADDNPKSSDVPLIVILFIIVTSFTVLLFLGGYGSVVSGFVAVDGLKKDNESGIPFVGNLMRPVRSIARFINKTKNDIDGILNVDTLTGRLGNLTDELSIIVQALLKSLNSSCPTCLALMDHYQDLAKNANATEDLLREINSTQNLLVNESKVLNEMISALKNDTLSLTYNCTTPRCDALNKSIATLRVLREYNDSTVYNFTDLNEAVRLIRQYSFDESQFMVNQSSISDEYRRQVLSIVQSIKESFDRIDQILNLTNHLNRNSSFLASLPWNEIDKVDQILPIVLKCVIIVAAAFIFIVVLLNLIALILGPPCIESNPKASQKTFVVSSQISFIIGPFLCILTLLVFLLASPLFREGCYDIRKESDSTLLKFVDWKAQQAMAGYSSFTISGVTIKLNISNISIIRTAILQSCKKDESLSSVLLDNLNVDNQTMDEIVNIFRPQIRKFLDNFNLSSLPIFSDETISSLNKTLELLRPFNLPSTNRSIPLIIPSLETIEELMINATEDLSQADQENMSKLINISLPHINSTAQNITAEEDHLLVLVVQLNNMSAGVSGLLKELIDDIEKSRISLATANITGDLEEAMVHIFKQKFWSFYDYLTGQLRVTMRCGELYEAFNSIFYSMCDLVIYPLNGYWFSVGACIVLLILGSLGGLWLGGLFARRHKALKNYDGTEHVKDEYRKGYEDATAKTDRSDDSFSPYTPHPLNQESQPILSRGQPRPLPPTNTADYFAPTLSTPQTSATGYIRAGQPAPISPTSISVQTTDAHYLPNYTRQQVAVAPNSTPSLYYNQQYIMGPQLQPGPLGRFPRPWRPQPGGMRTPQPYAPAPYRRF